MFKELSNLTNLFRNAQGIGQRFQEVTAELRHVRVSGTAGDGMVDVEMNGAGELLSIRLNPELVEHREHQRLEELIPIAVNEASSQAKQCFADAMKKMVADLKLPIPGLDKLLSQFNS